MLCLDLQAIRDLLIHKLGPDFARSAIENRDSYASLRVSCCAPTSQLCFILMHVVVCVWFGAGRKNSWCPCAICDMVGSIPVQYRQGPCGGLVSWSPTAREVRIFYFLAGNAAEADHSPTRVNAISEMLDPSSAPEIDMARLRLLCAQGEF